MPFESAASGADRDRRAEHRDQRAEAREKATGVIDPGAASDRSQAAGDRAAASADRAVAARERAESSLDGLTLAYRREAGLIALEREIARAKRTNQPFTLAFVDVDDLKGTNDSGGHAAGDLLLRAAVAAIRRRLRSYDLIVRFGGDEFLCGLPDLTFEDAHRRFSQVNEDLAAHGGSLTVGIAQHEGDASLEDLVALADGAMYGERETASSPFRRFRLTGFGRARAALPALDPSPHTGRSRHADR